MGVEGGGDVEKFWDLSVMLAVCAGPAASVGVPLSPEKGSIATGLVVVVTWNCCALEWLVSLTSVPNL